MEALVNFNAMNEPPIMLALLVAFILGFGLCCLCVLLAGKRQATIREIELNRELAQALTELDQLFREMQQNYALDEMALAARPYLPEQELGKVA
jgi:hypothetical protein